jgi:RND family efflux transporter MFP subunit
MTRVSLSRVLAGAALVAGACAPPPGDAGEEGAPAVERAAGRVVAAADTTLEATLDAAGVAAPVARATLGTKLMGTVTAVLVREGDRVAAGQPVVRIDARDLEAKRSQVSAALAEAEAVRRDAATQAARIRALHADSAATRSQLDAAETGLARAEAAVRQARAGGAELDAVSAYAVVRAPFDGLVTRRFVDPGAFAAPGAPLVAVEDGRRLRVSVAVAPDAARGVRRGDTVAATVEGARVPATVEGVVPAPAGSVYTVNAIVDNRGGRLLPGSAATLSLPRGARRAVVVPAAAVRREGDLTGVLVRGAAGDELRWVRLGTSSGSGVEVLAGLRAGEQVVIPDGAEPPPDVAAANRGS